MYRKSKYDEPFSLEDRLYIEGQYQCPIIYSKYDLPHYGDIMTADREELARLIFQLEGEIKNRDEQLEGMGEIIKMWKQKYQQAIKIRR